MRIKKRSVKTEVDMMRFVVSWLRDQKWEVFQEVQFGGSRCDIVARQGGVLWCIEGKMVLNLQVVAQAIHWRPYANYISIAVPLRQKNDMANDIFRWKGIGILLVNNLTEQEWHCPIIEDVRPRLWRKIGGRLAKNLYAESKDYAEAGNAQSKFWSPFKNTVREIHQALGHAQLHGMTTRELVNAIHHHYHCASTARSSLHKWLNEGVIDGVVGVGSPLRWYLKQCEPKPVEER